MIDEVFSKIFRREIPLPGNPLKAINSYLIKGEDRHLMIDTGMNRPECMNAMQSSLQELGVDLKRTDFFITHIHADHMGLLSSLATDSSKIYFNHPDAAIFRDPSGWEKLAASAAMNGFPDKELQDAINKHPGKRFHTQRELDLTLLGEGDKIQVGAYTLTCIETPGHTRGHMCLYEANSKILFSGDHVLDTITPNIALWSEAYNPLSHYLESLDKVNGYDVALVLPGHRRPFQNHRRRIAELKKHHDVRANEVVSILKKGKLNAYQVASQMTWDIDCERWADFPAPQKWFASGEALAHLQYLLGKGTVGREVKDGKAFFFLSN
jgi:glyoxylase-like metal-dependent hydrolase (beta-lactamase superfamily II)